MQLHLGEDQGWHLAAGKWEEQEDGIRVGRGEDGQGLQGYALAFYKPKAYKDIEAQFAVQMPANHADLGFIVRAQDPTHFYLIHFPQCGQGYRAQHFWAALSVADGSGYLRLLALNHVQRVPSNPLGILNQARLKVEGDHFQVWVNGHPALDVRDHRYRQGRIGLAGFAQARHGQVQVEGTEVTAPPWNEAVGQIKNWVVPFPDQGETQRGVSLVKTAAGTILCAFSSSTGRHLGRSTDGGRTWTVAPAPANMVGSPQVLRNGRLLSVALGSKAESAWSESTDEGKTWTAPAPIEFEAPAGLKGFGTGWPLELRDGTLIRFGLGGHTTSSEPITKWGAVHCQAFATRSTDGGRTWSPAANLDGEAEEMGNLDLTEPVGFETTDGRIMCLIRPIYSPWMWETWSHDQGRTWGPCVRGPFAGWAPSAPVRVQAGAVLFPTRFPGLTLHTTRDEGMSWDHTYIDTSIWAMGALCEVSPDKILFAYEDSWRDKLRLQFVQVTPEGLMPATA